MVGDGSTLVYGYDLHNFGGALFESGYEYWWRVKDSGGAWSGWQQFWLLSGAGAGNFSLGTELTEDICFPPIPNPEPTSVFPIPIPTPTPTPRPTATTEPTNTPTSEPTFFVAGQVTGPEGGGSPISGVNVCASGRCAVTDSSGH